jgi:hypothetical protein
MNFSVKFLSAVLCTAAIGSMGISNNADAADPGKLRIQNNSQFFMTYMVPLQDNWWNCDDAPARGFSVSVPPGITSPYFEFVRTDGHGCDGRQGQFAMIPSIPTYPAQPQQFWYDSHGSLQFQGPNPNYASQLTDDGNQAYTWIVTPTAANTGSAVAQASVSAAPSPTVPVFNSCSGGNQPCTTTAVCPKGMTIQSGWSFYIVPDDRSPAYGICGTASAACVNGTASCSVTTVNSGCGAPGWVNQTALVAIACQ